MNSLEKMRSRGMIPRAVLYARFSSDNQREESIDAQLRALEEFCKRNGTVIIEKYCDHAKSATTDDRPEFLRMIADSKHKNFDFVIVHKLDRFSRNRYDSAFYRRELKKNGVDLMSVLEQLDDSPESIILESVLEGMSEYYSKNLSREVMKGMKESALKCRHVGGRPPFGYKVNPETKQYEINEDEIEGVHFIFNGIDQGSGYTNIINGLNARGYKTRNGGNFGKNSLHEILRNEKYCGIYIYNLKTSKGANNSRNNHSQKHSEDVIRIPGGMPRIISDEVFQRVQVILKERKHKETSGCAKRNYLLTGRIFCGICGHAMNGSTHASGRNKNIHSIYICYKKKYKGSDQCKNKNINVHYIEDFVVKRIAEIVFNEANVPRLIEMYKQNNGSLNSDCESLIKNKTVSLQSVEQKIANVINVITQSGSPTLLSTLENLEIEKEVLIKEIEMEKAKLEENKLDPNQIIAAYRHAKEMFLNGTFEGRKELVKIYLKAVRVFPEYAVVEFCNVPSYMLNPATLGNNPSETESDLVTLHTYYILLNIQNKHKKNTRALCPKRGKTHAFVVEMRRIELLSESYLPGLSTSVVCVLKIPFVKRPPNRLFTLVVFYS